MIDLKGLGWRVEYVQRRVGSSVKLKDLSGVSQPQLSRLIRGALDNPGINSLLAIAEAGGVSAAWLITGEGEEEGVDPHGGYVSIPMIADSNKTPLQFDRDFFKGLGVAVENMMIFKQKTDCMSPQVPRGSIVLIDTSQQLSDGTGLIRLNDQLILRYLQVNPVTGNVIVTAHNTLHQAFEIEPQKIEYCGAAVWIGGTL